MTNSTVRAAVRLSRPSVVTLALILLVELGTFTHSALATTLDVQDSSEFAAGSVALVTGCDLNVSTDLGRVWSSSESLWAVASATVSNIRSDCSGQTMTVSLADVRGQSLLTGSTELGTGGSGIVDFGTSVDLNSVATVLVVIQKSQEVSVA